MLEKVYENIYRIVVELPKNPLRELNSYVICGGSRNLIMDTGFNTPECLRDLKEGLTELNIDMSKTDLLLTHFHADHVGLVNHIEEMAKAAGNTDFKIYMSQIDKDVADTFIKEEHNWKVQLSRFLAEGFPEEELKDVYAHHPAQRHKQPGGFTITPIDEGDIVKVGDIELKVMITPGHTPGHVCLYYEKEQIFFSGDTVLFNITPNISFWPGSTAALGEYFLSILKIRDLPVKLCLPGHRAISTDLKGRIDQLLQHHEERLQEVINILKANPACTGYDVARLMHWDIRAKDWSDFPAGQKWFAVGEAVAHLDFLVETNVVLKTSKEFEGRQVASYMSLVEKIKL